MSKKATKKKIFLKRIFDKKKVPLANKLETFVAGPLKETTFFSDFILYTVSIPYPDISILKCQNPFE